VQQMVPRGRGAILNVGSGSAYYPTPGQAGYAASKAFVHSYSQAVRAELRGTGVSVTVVNPGPVQTEILVAAGIDESFATTMPAILYMDARDVARIAIDALAAGKGVVVPGFPTRFATRMLSHVPRRILLPALAKRNPILQQQKG
jgi:short-subunit dehydrogenase